MATAGRMRDGVGHSPNRTISEQDNKANSTYVPFKEAQINARRRVRLRFFATQDAVRSAVVTPRPSAATPQRENSEPDPPGARSVFASGVGRHVKLMDNLRSVITVEIPHLRRYARALARNPDEADDLVQACLEKALSRASQWNPDKGLRSWLFRILHNDFVSSLRRRDREHEHRRRYPEADSTPASQENLFELNLVYKAMETLPPEQREALVLVAVSGFSYEESADVLDVPVGTVRSRLSRAREALRERMQSRPLESVPCEVGNDEQR